MVNLSFEALKVARPVHWIKNLSIFAALIFTSRLTDSSLFIKVIWAFIAFNFATSATYIFNDIVDQKQDRLHPIKKNRPIASGKLPVNVAFIEAVGLALLSVLFATRLNHLFQISILTYLILQVLYSLVLKNQTTIDILVIAIGFVIRIYAGAFVIDAHLSVWFLLCVISVALFLAAGKRRSELNTIKENGTTRKSLSKYSRELLNSYVTMFGNAAWMSWSLFAFFESPRASLNLWLLLAEISRTTTIDKLLMATIPLTIFGIMRYESLIFEDKSEAPEKLLLSDKGLLASVGLWLMVVLWVFYAAT
ncbi:MAG TPA: UbiA prenyltransferase family protein [Patescibacteria group bacterium]|nr:UbiA prenyltransferase family protein [Patescibacteria group bacterium]